MSGLEIHPHSRRITHLAIVGLSLLAAGSFALSLSHQVRPAEASPFPAAEPPTAQAVAAGSIPEARPAPDIQVAAVSPRRVPVAHADVPVDSPEPAVAESPSPTDASTTASDPPPRAPAPPADPSPASSPADPPT